LKKLKILKFVGLLLLSYLIAGMLSVIPAIPSNTGVMDDDYLVDLSIRFISSVKKGDSKKEQDELRVIPAKKLIEGLSNDAAKKVFWMNLYNGWYQLGASQLNEKIKDIYTDRFIPFSDFSMSLDDIEHGVLRRYRWKYSLGYFPQFFPSQRIKRMAVSKIDYRIHFALNCGAKSCPPITIYKIDNVNEQLDKSTSRFIISETGIDEKDRVIYTSKILSWFKGDFRTAGGVKSFLSSILSKDLSGYKIKYKEYNWSIQLNNYGDD
jgi:hypothetical protein